MARIPGKGGRHPTDLGDIFHVIGTGSTPIQVGDVGDDPSHGKGPGEFSSQSHQAYYRETLKSMGGLNLVVSTYRENNG